MSTYTLQDLRKGRLGKPKPVRVRKAKKRVKRISRGALVRKAHALLREIVMLRDGGCVCPPPTKGHSLVRQAGHIVRSTKGGSRFSLWNVHEQCSSCNSRHVRDWQVYQEWFIGKFGDSRWHEILDESKKSGLKSYEIEELIIELEKVLARQREDENFKPYFTQEEIFSGAWRGT